MMERAIERGWQGVAQHGSTAVITQPGSWWRSWGFWVKLCGGIAIVMFAIFAGAVLWLRWNAAARRDAVAAIKKARGSVTYEWEEPDVIRSAGFFTIPGFPAWMSDLGWSNRPTEEGGPDAPPWVVSLLGVDCVGDVTSVTLPRRAPAEVLAQAGKLKRLKSLRLDGLVLSDRSLQFLEDFDHLEDLTLVRSQLGQGALSHLAHLKKLQSLNLLGTDVDNAALASIAGLTELTSLNLSGTMIDSAGLAALKGLSKLEDLNLDRTAISDQGLSVLAGLPALAHLSMYGTRLTGSGLVHVRGLKRLESLRLEGTDLRDPGLVHLANVTSLKVLGLKGTSVGDAGIKCLTGLTNLEELTLDRTGVTDSGLAQLAGLPHLVIVSVQHTRVTEAGIAAVQAERHSHAGAGACREQEWRDTIGDGDHQSGNRALTDTELRIDE